jgi:DNA mismatch repair protein MutL
MSIHILPSEVASQIAAGEVIERPASVVKELLENSIDAGARFITVQAEEAGRRLIEVADDGYGIQAEELALAVERHATSKLQSADDLFRIRTLGFRGEALASIGSVARLTITSRPVESEMGALLRVEGGSGAAVQATGAPVGTVVRVENLFFNVPARLKFLKTDTTERRQIDMLVTRYALAYPNIRFQLKQDGKPALQTSGNGKRREVLAALSGVDVARQMLEVLAEEEELSIQGFISPTALTRSNRREIVFFVNGRPVQDAALVAALIKAYHTLLMVGRYPLGILFLETPAESVDVNVHPTKAEVRFRDPNRVFSGVQTAVRRALLAHTPIPRLENQLRWTPGPDWGAATQKAYPDWQMAQEAGPQAATDDFTSDDRTRSAFQTTAENQSPQAGLPGARIPLLRLVGQIASAYLVAEGPDGLYLIDQHAAHERVLFERFMAQRSGEIPAQALLQPATIELPASSARLLEPQLPMLQRLGFEVEVFGSNTYLVRAIPDLLSGSDPAAALRVLVEDFEEDETPLRDEVEARIIARVCKRAAVRAGHTLSPQEQKTLLADLENCQSPRTCPHGRPTMIHLSVDLLERQFGRRGAR